LPQSTKKSKATSYSRSLKQIKAGADAALSRKQAAREVTLPISRSVIQRCANSIRATHRGEYKEAHALLKEVVALLHEAEEALKNHPDLYYAGFIEDAQKEFAEASVMLAVAEGNPIPRPEDLGVGYPPYLNGLGEAVGEMRRYILDALRHDDTSRCEEILDIMDEAYTLLVTIDYPDALTRGLRRTTDMVRGVLERTRGDLTVAIRQRSLEQKLMKLSK